MVKALKTAFDEIATLPDADQEEIARQLLAYVDKVRRLRADLREGIAALDRGEFDEIADEDLDARLDDLVAPARR
jgi:predicted transcriptional regulator